MALAARVRDHTPASIRLEIRTGARAEAAYLRASGSAAIAARNGATEDHRPALTVVPRRVRALRTTTIVFGLMFASFLALAAFQVLVSQQQIELDRATRTAQVTRSRFDDLREENANLRNPERLRADGSAFGLTVARRGDDIDLDPLVRAEIAARSGVAIESERSSGLLARHQQLKRILAEARGEDLEP